MVILKVKLINILFRKVKQRVSQVKLWLKWVEEIIFMQKVWFVYYQFLKC